MASFFGFGTCKANGCGAFNGADPSKDTVQFAPIDKENVAPEMRSIDAEIEAAKLAEQQELARVEQEKREQEEKEQRQREIEAEQERQREEERVRAEEEALRRAEEERAEEEQRRAEQAAKEFLEREAAERERAAEAAAAAEKEALESARAAEAKAKVDAFLQKNGYAGVNIKRTKMMKSKYALHTAVKQQDALLVSLLLQAGADPALKKSNGQTPLQYAQKLNVNHSHDEVLAALSTQ